MVTTNSAEVAHCFGERCHQPSTAESRRILASSSLVIIRLHLAPAQPLQRRTEGPHQAPQIAQRRRPGDRGRSPRARGSAVTGPTLPIGAGIVDP